MMKRFMTIALVAGMSLTFAACNNLAQQNEINGGNGNNVVEAAPSLVFSFAYPKGQSVTYGDLYQDAKEWYIQNLWMYTFVDDGAGDYTLVEAPKDIAADLVQDTQAEYKYTYKIDPKNKEHLQYHFLFVANEPVPAGATANAKKSAIITALQSKSQAAGSSDMILLDPTTTGSDKMIAMTGVAQLDLGNGNSTPIIPMNIANTVAASKIKVDLIRTIARIDVYNTVKRDPQDATTDNLVVTGLKLKRAYDKAYLFSPVDMLTATDSRAAISGLTRLTGDVTSFSQIPTGGLTANTTTSSPHRNIAGLMEKAFYLHEGSSHTTKEEAPAVEVTFNYKNKTNLKLEVPFFQGGKPVPVKRNNIYFVVLGDGNAPIPVPELDKLTAYVAVKPMDWMEADQLNVALNPITVSGVDVNSQTVSFAHDAAAPSSAYTITSNFANGGTAFTATLKNTAAGTQPDWITVSTTGASLNITKLDNNPYNVDRVAVIVLNDNVATGFKYEIKVLQKANPAGTTPASI